MRFLAVDLSSVFRRMWEAAEGKEFGEARQRTIRKIQSVADGYDRIVVARDAAPSFRKALFPEYKANRQDPGEAFREQMKLAIADLRELGATVWVSPSLTKHEGKDYYGEADDVLASFALWYQDRVGEHADWSLTILTGDTDLWAIIDDELRISVMTLDGKIVQVDQVFERFGVLPHLVPEHKALTGDSDNYKGFPGVGPTIAAAILTQLPSLQGVEDRSAADAIITAIVEGKDCPMKLAKNVTAALKEGGLALLNLGRSLAYLRPTLRTLPDGKLDTLDFSLVLAAPNPMPRPVDPVYQQAAASQQAPPAPAAVPASAPAPSAAIELPQSAALARPADDSPFTRSLNEAMVFAAQLHASGLYRSLPNPAACLVLTEHARAFGIPAVILAQYAHCIKGKLGFGSQVLMAVIRNDPSCKRFRFDLARCTDQQAVVLFWRTHAGDADEKGEYTFTLDEAKIAKYLDGQHSAQWFQRRKLMLMWAAARETARLVWPERSLGLRTPEDEGSAGEFPEAMLEEDG